MRKSIGRIVVFGAFFLASLAVPMAAIAQNPSTPPPSGFPLGPPARILTFTAKPDSIQPGQSVTLTWAVVNADRITVDQGIGVVATRGSEEVTPAVTTTYTLRAIGRGGADQQSITVTVAGTTAAPAASEPTGDVLASKPVPHLTDGTPDLSGVYIGGFGIRPTGKIDLKPGREKYNVGEDYGGDLGEHCLPPGVPGATEQPYPLQIVEKPGLVVILYEAYHLFRVIPTDGRPHPSDLDPTWMGNSVGRWEGDTLVVDVTAFNDKTAVGDYRHTTAYHVVERYRRPVFDKIEYQATVEDPNVFAAPFTVAGTLQLHPEWQLQEYICEENNHNYKDLFEEYKK
jgi:hypothetical protein